MKGLFEAQPQSPEDVPSHASSSGQSREDQEMGTAATSRSVDVFERSKFGCLSQEMYRNFARAIVAEMVGTFILMFCISGIIASTQKNQGQVSLLLYAATAGLTVIVVVFAIGNVSGAHVNPSVTVAFAIFGPFPWRNVPLYIFAQTMGSIAATFAGMYVFDIKPDVMVTRPLQGCASAFWVELIVTFIVMFLVASLTHQAQSVGHLSGFVVGIAIGLSVLISGPVSGGSMNPARSLGAAIASWNFGDIWIYILAPTIGAVGGALLFQFLRLQHRTCKSTTTSTTCILHQI